MTNEQKEQCRRLASETNLSAAEIAKRVGCAHPTASKYVHAIRPGLCRKRPTWPPSIKEGTIEIAPDLHALAQRVNELSIAVVELQARLSQPPKRFLTIGDAMIRSGLSGQSIRRLISAGQVTPLRPVRGRILLEINEFDSAILSSNKRPRKGRGMIMSALNKRR